MENNHKQITGAVIQCRLGSTRLPGKAIRLLHRQPLIVQVLNRLKAAKSLHKIILATTYQDLDEVLVPLALEEGFQAFRGSEEDVLGRYVQAAAIFHLTSVVRVTGDNPLVCPRHLDLMVEQFLRDDLDYSWAAGLPLGTGCEVVKASVLEHINTLQLEPRHREHVTLYIREHIADFKAKPLAAAPQYQRPYRLTVDTLVDFQLVEELYAKLYKPHRIIELDEVIAYLDAHPHLAALNAHVPQVNPLKTKS